MNNIRRIQERSFDMTLVSIGKSAFIIFFAVEIIGDSILGNLRAIRENASFRCVKGKYIQDHWFCDGFNDCGDGSDESYGCNEETCGRAQFTCQDMQCLPISIRCNGISECKDGSDEMYCDHEPKTEDCTMDKRSYLCKDKLRCIDLAYVCDGSANCFDGSDETDGCFAHGGDVCDTCFHSCFPTPSGPRCFCNTTDHKFDALCDEMKPCKPDTNCAQRCVRFQNTEHCSCAHGYQKDKLCKSCCSSDVPYGKLLLFSTHEAIKLYNFTSNQTTVIHNTASCTALTGAQNNIYWSAISDEEEWYSIFRTSIGTRSYKVEEIIGDQFLADEITSIAVDWIAGNIYFTTSISLSVCSIDGRICTRLKSFFIGTGYVAVGPRSGSMFWTYNTDNKYFKSCILKSNMDGSDEDVLVSDNLRSPTSLTVDEESQRIFWLDSVLKKIETVRFDGSNRKIILWDPRASFNSFFHFEDVLFWMKGSKDIFQSRIFSQSLYEKPKLLVEDKASTNHIYIYNHLLQYTNISNPCKNSPCVGLCLLHPTPTKRLNYTCICQNFKHSSKQDRWCDDLEVKIEMETEQAMLMEEFNKREPLKEVQNKPIILYVVFAVIAVLGSIGFYFAWRKWTESEVGEDRQNITQEEL